MFWIVIWVLIINFILVAYYLKYRANILKNKYNQELENNKNDVSNN